MAEIRVQEKGGTGVWPWTLGVVVLVLWGGLSGCEGDDLRDAPAADVTDRAESVGAETTTDLAGEEDALPDDIRDYLAFVRESDPDQDAGPDHAYVSEGLERLAAALARVAERDDLGGGSLEGQLEDVRATAERVQEDPDSPRHAALVQAAFTSIADVFESLEKAGHPELASGTAGLRQAAQAIQPGEPLLNQIPGVTEFFARAGDALGTLEPATS